MTDRTISVTVKIPVDELTYRAVINCPMELYLEEELEEQLYDAFRSVCYQGSPSKQIQRLADDIFIQIQELDRDLKAEMAYA